MPVTQNSYQSQFATIILKECNSVISSSSALFSTSAIFSRIFCTQLVPSSGEGTSFFFSWRRHQLRAENSRKNGGRWEQSTRRWDYCHIPTRKSFQYHQCNSNWDKKTANTMFCTSTQRTYCFYGLPLTCQTFLRTERIFLQIENM